jgi:uncharacterized protein YciI
MFIITVKYLCPIEQIEVHLAAHRAFLDRYYENGMLICSGPQNPRTGGIIVSNAPNRALVEQMITEDPFYLNKVAEYSIVEFAPVKYASGFEPFVKQA